MKKRNLTNPERDRYQDTILVGWKSVLIANSGFAPPKWIAQPASLPAMKNNG
jgi:hypothetical protein